MSYCIKSTNNLSKPPLVEKISKDEICGSSISSKCGFEAHSKLNNACDNMDLDLRDDSKLHSSVDMTKKTSNKCIIICSKQMSLESILKRHMRTHCIVKLYACVVESYCLVTHVQVHIREVHQVEI